MSRSYKIAVIPVATARGLRSCAEAREGPSGGGIRQVRLQPRNYTPYDLGGERYLKRTGEVLPDRRRSTEFRGSSPRFCWARSVIPMLQPGILEKGILLRRRGLHWTST
jgi:hypothetical protein